MSISMIIFGMVLLMVVLSILHLYFQRSVLNAHRLKKHHHLDSPVLVNESSQERDIPHSMPEPEPELIIPINNVHPVYGVKNDDYYIPESNLDEVSPMEESKIDVSDRVENSLEDDVQDDIENNEEITEDDEQEILKRLVRVFTKVKKEYRGNTEITVRSLDEIIENGKLSEYRQDIYKTMREGINAEETDYQLIERYMNLLVKVNPHAEEYRKTILGNYPKIVKKEQVMVDADE